jgi:hypothetical protein
MKVRLVGTSWPVEMANRVYAGTLSEDGNSVLIKDSTGATWSGELRTGYRAWRVVKVDPITPAMNDPEDVATSPSVTYGAHDATPACFTKHDGGKLRYRLLPVNAVRELLKALEHGAKKYGDDNWHKCDDPLRYYDALNRHVEAWRDGEQADEESGLSHLAHAAACVVFMLGLECIKKGGKA